MDIPTPTPTPTPNLSPDMLDNMETGEVAALDPETLDALFWLVSEENTVAKRHEKRLHDAFEARYAGKASNMFLADARDTGTVHLNDGRYDVTVTRPKRVKWNEAKLREGLDKLDPETARHFAKVKITIDERRFDAATPDVRAILAGARTVETGKAVYTLAERKELAA